MISEHIKEHALLELDKHIVHLIRRYGPQPGVSLNGFNIVTPGPNALAQAMNNASLGDTLYVTAGTYREVIKLRNGVNWWFEPGAVVDYFSSAAGSLFSDGDDVTHDDINVLIMGYGTFRRGGAAVGGIKGDCIVAIHGNTNLYIEGASFENYCTTKNETEVFKLEDASNLTVKQTSPGIVRSNQYDLIVGYTSTGTFRGDFLDLIQGAESICEYGTFAAPKFHLHAKRALAAGGSENNMFDFTLAGSFSTGIDVDIKIDEYCHHTGNFSILYTGDGGKYIFECPLAVCDVAIPITTLSIDQLVVRNSNLVSLGTNQAAMDLQNGQHIIEYCNLFPSGTAKSIIGSTTVQAKACYATENADTAGGITLLGNLTKVAGFTAPTI